MRLPFIAKECCLLDYKAIGNGCYKLVLNPSNSVIDFNEADIYCQTSLSLGYARLADLDEFTISKPVFLNFINCIGVPTNCNGGKLYTISVLYKINLT